MCRAAIRLEDAIDVLQAVDTIAPAGMRGRTLVMVGPSGSIVLRLDGSNVVEMRARIGAGRWREVFLSLGALAAVALDVGAA